MPIYNDFLYIFKKYGIFVVTFKIIKANSLLEHSNSTIAIEIVIIIFQARHN